MNTSLQLLEQVHASSLPTHPTTTFSSMLVLGMMQLILPPPPRGGMYIAAGAQDLNAIEEPQKAHFSQDINTPSDDFYQVHQAKQGRPPPTPYLGFRESPQKANTLYQETFQKI